MTGALLQSCETRTGAFSPGSPVSPHEIFPEWIICVLEAGDRAGILDTADTADTTDIADRALVLARTQRDSYPPLGLI